MMKANIAKIQQMDDLDAVRGIGILMVFFFHASAFFKYDIWFLPPFLKSFITAGHSGVTMLFVLSAFLLTQPYIKSFGTGVVPSWEKFYMRRILRILPLYLLMVAVSALFLKNYKTSMLALNIVWGVGGNALYPFSNVWWAVYTEIQFYILLPIIGYFLVYKKKIVLAFCFILYLVLYFCLIFYHLNIHSIPLFWRTLHSFLGRGTAFIIGGGAAWIFLHHGDFIKSQFLKNPVVVKASDAILVFIFLLVNVLLLIATEVTYPKMEAHYHYWHIIEAILWSGVIMGLLLLPLKFKKWVANPFFRQIGKISYSIYLLHYPFLVYGNMAIRKLNDAMQMPVPPKGVLILIVFIACIGASALTYRFIEKPFLEKKSYFY